MDRFDNRHSRIVAWLRIVLPLGALAVLSSMFLLSRSVDPRDTIPFVELSVEALAREERVGAPYYTGVTDDGAALYVTADSARPLPGSGGARIEADGVNATLLRRDGLLTALVAPSGRIDTRRQRARLAGGVEITTSDGLSLTMNAVVTRLDQTDIRSVGGVEGQLRGSDLEAGRLVVTAPPGSEGRALFTGGVKLIYQPGT